MPRDPRPIFLVGFMGSGKSTLARQLAQALGWEAADTDEQVEQRSGRSIERIFRESGEEHFRSVELEVLRALDGRRRCVVAAGGGLFQAAQARRFMKSRGRTVWLDAPLEVCSRRVAAGPARPLWPTGDSQAFRVFFERRRAVYALAELRLDVADDDPAGAVRRLLGRL